MEHGGCAAEGREVTLGCGEVGEVCGGGEATLKEVGEEQGELLVAGGCGKGGDGGRHGAEPMAGDGIGAIADEQVGDLGGVAHVLAVAESV